MTLPASIYGGGRGRYVVVGGGMSGMAAAWMLQRAGHSVEILEADDELAGRSQTGMLGDRAVTFGGKNIGRNYSLFREFTASLGEHPYEPFGINASPVVKGRVRTFDSTSKLRSVARFAREPTPLDMARFLPLISHVRRDEANRFLGSEHFARLGARRDHHPLAHWFSKRFARSVLRTVTVRMNGAEPDEVWLGNFGSNLGMLLDTYDQLSHGTGPLVDDFRASHRVRTGVSVEGLAVDDRGIVCGVHVRGAGGGPVETLCYDGVVLAVPAVAAAPLVRALDGDLAEVLASVCYFPAAVVLAEYDRPVFTPQVRALAFPAGQPLSNGGAYGVDDRHIVRYTFSGQAAREHLERGFDPEELLRLGEEQIGRHTPLADARRVRFVARSWSTAYCAYVPYHAAFVERVRALLTALPGLHLTGDYLRGVSIEACFRAARDCVDDIESTGGVMRARLREVARAGS
jgi:oxygen-dependent protoporphyrinogen oxidase